MADYDSSLPVRTETDGDVKSVIVDPVTTTQQLGVDSNGRIGVVAYGNNGTTDVVIPIDATSGGVKVDIVDATGITVDVDIDQVTDGQVVGSEKGTIAVGTDGTNYQFMSMDATGKPQMDLAEVSVTAVPVSADSNANTSGNPIFVQDVGSAGDSVHDYNTASSIPSSATTTHTYTVTAAKTLLLKQVRVTGSGKLKVIVATGVAASEVDVDVGFNSTATPDIIIEFPKPIEVAATQNVLLTIENRDLQAQDVYSSINGEEI